MAGDTSDRWEVAEDNQKGYRAEAGNWGPEGVEEDNQDPQEVAGDISDHSEVGEGSQECPVAEEGIQGPEVEAGIQEYRAAEEDSRERQVAEEDIRER